MSDLDTTATRAWTIEAVQQLVELARAGRSGPGDQPEAQALDHGRPREARRDRREGARDRVSDDGDGLDGVGIRLTKRAFPRGGGSPSCGLHGGAGTGLAALRQTFRKVAYRASGGTFPLASAFALAA